MHSGKVLRSLASNVSKSNPLLIKHPSSASILIQRRNHAHNQNGEFYSDSSKTSFGFENVTEKDKRDKVLEVFHNVAEKYDLMNDAMSFGVHRLWKDHFVDKLNPVQGMKIIDVAGGTGDIAFRMMEKMRQSDHISSQENTEDNVNPGSRHVVCCDINASMLQVGQKRALDAGFTDSEITWVEGDAQNLPFDSNSFDAYTIAFGIRNVVHIDKALSEAFRVLKPGGRFMCLEFSKVENDLLAALYDLYSFQIIPPMGTVLAGDWKSYQYLVESIRKFPDQTTFEDMMREAGFRCVNHENLTNGVAAIHSGYKLEGLI